MNPLQKAAVRRKSYYIGAILVLFTISMFWRGIIPVPLSSTARAGEPPTRFHRIADSLNNRNVLNQALGLDLRELEQGEPEIEAEGLRLALIGSRGFAVTYLWQAAIENQKRGDYHKMDQRITLVTRLQPHFISPWIFQSWNIAYNVSVEMQGSGDMYHYIARGIDLLAEGERRNSHVFQGRKIGSPDMRYQVGFYYQNKFGVSDQVEVLRCLFQLSCISPDDRNPSDLIDPATGGVNQPKFREFCEKYPHLVRRLRGEDLAVVASGDEAASRRAREGLKCPKPEQVIQFLRENRSIPTRYKSAKVLAEPERQFPALPPKFAEGPDEAHPGMDTKDDFTAFKAARAWYAYSLVPVPENPRDVYDKPLPSPTPRPGEYDPLLYRVPRSPMLIIFRQGGPRVQSAQAEMEQKEGWFDDEGWRVDPVWVVVTNETLAELRDAQVPEAVLSKLNALKNKKLYSEGHLARRISKILEPGEIQRFQTLIVDKAEKSPKDKDEPGKWWFPPDPNAPPSFKLTHQCFEDLRSAKVPESVLLKLKPLKYKEISKSDLLGAIGVDEAKQFLDQILKSADKSSPRPLNLVIGQGQPWSLVEWRQAATMWSKHGEQNGLEVSEARLKQYAADARETTGGALPQDPTPEQLKDPAIRKRYEANMALFFYPQNRSVTNFPYFLAAAEAEARPDTVQARKILSEAEQARKIAETAFATEFYEEGLELWKSVLLKDRTFHRPERSDHPEEETFAYELMYHRLLVKDDERVRAEANKIARAASAVIPFLSDPFPAATPQWSKDAQKRDPREELKWFVVETKFSPFGGLMVVNDERKGGPWIRDQVKEGVRAQQGLQRKGAGQQRPAGPAGGPPPGSGGEAP